MTTARNVADWYQDKFHNSRNCWPTMKSDHEALVFLTKIYNIESVFEFGTFEGYTTLLLWLQNSIKRIKTIDINDKFETNYCNPSHLLRNKNFYGSFIKGTPVEMEFYDSMKYEVEEEEQYDMIFIDGNHDYEHVMNDTELALEMNPKIIVWHDYGTADDVTNYINELKDSNVNIRQYGNGSIIAWMEISKEAEEIGKKITKLKEGDNDIIL